MRSNSLPCEAGRLARFPKKRQTIGILALQGAIEKHKAMCERLEVPIALIRYADQFDNIQGLIIPGGESTTIGKLLTRFNLFAPMQKRIKKGLPVYGTCAGLILLAKNIIGYKQTHFGILNITIARNAYGSQVESFEADIDISCLGKKPFRAVFIRAPIIKEISKDVRVLGRFQKNPVIVQQSKILASSFHPELTEDLRIHRYFIKQICGIY